MTRVVKSPEIRQAELLDCAQRLFFQNSYDDTTVNDIIREAGVSKGAFYHYFPSKEALLEALATRLAKDSFGKLEEHLTDPSLNATERLNALFSGSRQLKADMAPQLRNTFDVILRPENVVLFHRIDQALTVIATPFVANILAKGREEGVFDVQDPRGVAEMFLELRVSMAKVMHRAIQRADQGHIEQAIEMLDERLKLYGLVVDRILKLPDGTIAVSEPGFARALLAKNLND
ncbi:TetR/AcrR family transcriptional regulator [Mesorhizobium sp. CCNWLW179-1]|uniref:TetR/AcrR family transcriptional regulator n=1 Tax=unclassified Mesorhizobium TaxID=325217 RepID=UPI0030152E68